LGSLCQNHRLPYDRLSPCDAHHLLLASARLHPVIGFVLPKRLVIGSVSGITLPRMEIVTQHCSLRTYIPVRDIEAIELSCH
jgi:hypothetical protein